MKLLGAWDENLMESQTKRSCIIIGGGGYIGRRWAGRLASTKRFDRIVLADLERGDDALPPGAEFVVCDARIPLAAQLPSLDPDWIFNFAAVHREPGHEAHAYFDTNLAGARNAVDYATATGCRNILFTSSIAVYGPTSGPTSETSPLYPVTPYGISKLCAELIQDGWQQAGPGRRLLVCRPGVIYGPGDPGNILRMIRAVKRGYFLFPGRRSLRKSYGYIEGLLDSFEFAIDGGLARLTFNYVERETETLGRLVELIQDHFGRRVPTVSVPLPLLQAVAALVQVATRGRSAVHPVRVRKAAVSTHIVPKMLGELGFDFRYDFDRSLKDWAASSPEDFS